MENVNDYELSELEAQFCLLYVSAPAPYGGNAAKCYKAVFGKPLQEICKCSMADSDEDRRSAQQTNFELSAQVLMQKPAVKDRISELEDLHAVNAATLKPRLTKMLLKVSEECSTDVYEDKFGNKISPAALRSVAVSAIKELNDMYGMKEDIAHTVKLEGKDGAGIVFNVIAPNTNNDGREEELNG